MQTETFTKGQSVTGQGLYARTRYVVLQRHRDGTVTVKAMFFLDEEGKDRPGYLGYKYRVDADSLVPLPVKQAA